MGFFNKLFGSTKQSDQKHTQKTLQTDGIDLSKVYPRIKGVFTDDNPDPVTTKTTIVIDSIEDNIISKPLAEDIAIVYMIDTGYSFEVIQYKHLTNDITIDMIHEAALSNMAKAITDTTNVDGDPNDVMMVTNGGNFEATMVLADFLWEQLEPVFQDNICVAIPANDLLFISASNNPEGRESLRRTVRFYFDENETTGLIVRNIYERNGLGWKLVEKA
jgi:uncharacterized protein YtpQ (UPF0354 family)